MLPIDNYRKKIVNLIRDNDVIVITGKTGCGKSTRVPQYILEDLIQKNGDNEDISKPQESEIGNKGEEDSKNSANSNFQKKDKIIVCTPTRISAFSLAKYVARCRKSVLGREIGYAIAGERISSFEHTVIEYQTIGVLKEMLVHRTIEKYFSTKVNSLYIIIDEIHERGIDQDTCLYLIKRYFREKTMNVKLILMSATIDPKLFQEYFVVKGKRDVVPHLNVPDRNYTVKEVYLDEVIKKNREFEMVGEMFKWKEINEYELLKSTFTVATHLLDQIHRNEPLRKTVLVFLPGLAEILQFERLLYEKAGFNSGRKYPYKIYILHSMINIKDQKRVFDPFNGSRKIILSTNISESSITVPSVEIVMDLCYMKEMNLNVKNGAEELLLKFASKENLDQRKGRAGRCRNGIVFRMIPRKYFQTKIQISIVPEILRVSLSHLIMKLITMKIGKNVKFILRKFISPPSSESIEKAIKSLVEINGLDENNKITSFGKFMSSLPLAINNCLLVYYGRLFGYLDELIIISALIENDGVFQENMRYPIQALKRKYIAMNKTNSDIFSNYFTFIEMKKREEEIGKSNFYKGRYIKEHHLSFRKIKDVEMKIELCYEKLRMRPSYWSDISTEPTDIKILFHLLFGAYQKNICIAYKQGKYQMDSTLKTDELDHISVMKINCGDTDEVFELDYRYTHRFLEKFDGGFGKVKSILKDNYCDSGRQYYIFFEKQKESEINPVTLVSKFGRKEFQRLRNSSWEYVPWTKSVGVTERFFLPLFYSKKAKISRDSILSPFKNIKEHNWDNPLRIKNKKTGEIVEFENPQRDRGLFFFTSQHKFAKNLFYVSMNTMAPDWFDSIGFLHMTFMLFGNKLDQEKTFGGGSFLKIIQNNNVYYFRPFLNEEFVRRICDLRKYIMESNYEEALEFNPVRKKIYSIFIEYQRYVIYCLHERIHPKKSLPFIKKMDFIQKKEKADLKYYKKVVRLVKEYGGRFISKRKCLILLLVLRQELHWSRSILVNQVKRLEFEEAYLLFYIDEDDNFKLQIFEKHEEILLLKSIADRRRSFQIENFLGNVIEKIKNRYDSFVECIKKIDKRRILMFQKKREQNYELDQEIDGVYE